MNYQQQQQWNNWQNWQQPGMNQWQDYNYNNNQQQAFQPPLPSEEPKTETPKEDESKIDSSISEAPPGEDPPLPFVSHQLVTSNNDMEMGSPEHSNKPPPLPPQPPANDTQDNNKMDETHLSDINSKLLSESMSSQMQKDLNQAATGMNQPPHFDQPPNNHSPHMSQPSMNQPPMNQWNNFPPNQNFNHQYPPHPHNNHPHPSHGNHQNHHGNQGPFMQRPPHFPHNNNFNRPPHGNHPPRFPGNQGQFPMMFNQGPPGMGVAPRQKVLPAWIRAELAKREEEKMKKEQKEMEKNIENLQEQKLNNNGGIPGKSKFDSDSEESDQELPQDDRKDDNYSDDRKDDKYSDDDDESVKEDEDFDREAVKMQCTMRFITEILLDVTGKEIKEVVKRELYKAKRGKIYRKLKFKLIFFKSKLIKQLYLNNN